MFLRTHLGLRLRRAADEFAPAVAEVAKTFGRSRLHPKLLASFATGKFLSAARLNDHLYPE